MKDRLEKRARKILPAADTTINGIASNHLIVNVYDTVINNERNYTLAHLYISKLSGLPDRITIASRNTTFGNGVSTYYSETSYSDYEFNQPGVNLALKTIPKGFHTPIAQDEMPDLLPIGTVAPAWTLNTSEGKKTSLTQLKGKVIMLDFFFVGCYGCMLSLKPLNKFHEKYKGQNFEIISLTERDGKESVNRFTNRYNIKYPIYINTAAVVDQYNVKSFPTFYFIDKEGKIASVFVGYDKDFEEKVSSIVDSLLAK
ncbi:MAG: TlpA disulfide reductase family protein [Mucilaginibacter sp.]